MNINLKNILFSDTSKDTTIVFLGTGTNVFLAGLFVIVVPRILGPSDYGIFSTVVATGIMAANIANFGIDSGILKFVTPKSPNREIYLSLAFRSYVILGLTTAIIGLTFAPLLAQVLNHSEISNFLRLAFVSVILVLITNFFVASLQAQKDFFKASLVHISANFVRLILLGIAAFFMTLNLTFLTILFFLVPVISAVLGNMFFKFDYKRESSGHFLTFHKYNLWVAFSLIISSIPIDNYLLLKIKGPIATGLYAAPFKALTFVYQFAANFSRVLAPRFSSFETRKKARNYFFKSLGIVAIAAVGLLIVGIVGSPVIHLLFGSSFLPSESIFPILTGGFIFFFASTVPSAAILYFMGRSQVVFWVTLARFMVFFILLFVLIPTYSLTGAAVSYLIIEAITFFSLFVYCLIKFR